MKKVIILQGLPASGKSTWAKQQVKEHPGTYKRISKDDLRAMFDCSKWSPDNEKFVLRMRDTAIIQALENGKHVIVDDTNLHPKHIQKITDLVKTIGANVEIKFFEISVDDAIKRDLQRTASVGEAVIRKMYEDFLMPKTELIIQNSTLPSCVIVDIDGTIADKGTRSPFAWDKVGEDTPKASIVRLVQILSERYTIFFFSGRDSICRAETEEWLQTHVMITGPLLMRPKGDSRKDSVIKRELFEANISGKYFVEFVLDDRNQVVDMWRRELGLICLQVDYGNF